MVKKKAVAKKKPKGNPGAILLCRAGGMSVSMDSRQYTIVHSKRPNRPSYFTSVEGVARYMARSNLHDQAEEVKWDLLIKAFDKGVKAIVEQLKGQLPLLRDSKPADELEVWGDE
ncbi:MAG: hypothetical protein ACXABY_01585 [Candidatus Thorarchaeota archaeon]|jgi:hypothetical protein